MTMAPKMSTICSRTFLLSLESSGDHQRSSDHKRGQKTTHAVQIYETGQLLVTQKKYKTCHASAFDHQIRDSLSVHHYTTCKQLSNGVTRFDVKWSVNWFVSLAVNIYFVTCHTFLLFYFSNLLWLCVSTVSSRSNATIGYLHLHKMPPLFCYYTWQPNLPR